MAQAWSFVSAGTVATGSAPSVSVPSTYSAGNLFVLVVITDTLTSLSAPSGWDYGYDSNKLRVFYKIASSSESSVSFTGLGTNAKCAMVCYANILSEQTNGTLTRTTTSTTCTTSTVATTGDTLVLSLYGVEAIASTLTAPASTISRVLSNPTSSVCGLLICDEYNANGATTTARTMNSTAGTVNWGLTYVMNQSTGFMGF